MEDKVIYRICGRNIEAMTTALLMAANLREKIRTKAVALQKNEAADIRIGIKPNLVTPSPAAYGATTHREIIEALIKYLQDEGFRSITIMEGSWVGDNTEEAFELLGYRSLAEKYGVALIDTKKEPGVKVHAGGMELEICRCATETEFLINVPVLKGHCQTKMTCALKNMKGLIPDREKRRFHKLGLHRPIACLNAALPQDFILVDDICGDPDFEEGGNPMEKHMLLSGSDPVQMDCYAAWELGYAPLDIPYIGMAAGLGAGKTVEGQPETADFIFMEQRGAAAQKAVPVPEGLDFKPRSRGQSCLDISYAVEDADTCSACYANLTEAFYRLQEDGYELIFPEKIAIGQGMRGKKGRFGIGACTSCFTQSVPGCPPETEAIFEALKRWMTK